MSQKNKYPLISAGKRIAVNALDYLLVIIVSILVTYALTFFLFDNDYKNILPGKNILFSGMLFLAFLINCVIWFLYFIVQVYFWKGKTVFSHMLKTKIYWSDNTDLLKRLLKYQGLPVAAVYFNTMLIVLISFAFDNPIQYISNIFVFNNSNAGDTWTKMAAGVLLASAVILSFPTMGVIVNIIMNSHTTTILDESCKFYNISLIGQKSETKPKDSPKSTALPGLMDSTELEQL